MSELRLWFVGSTLVVAACSSTPGDSETGADTHAGHPLGELTGFRGVAATDSCGSIEQAWLEGSEAWWRVVLDEDVRVWRVHDVLAQQGDLQVEILDANNAALIADVDEDGHEDVVASHNPAPAQPGYVTIHRGPLAPGTLAGVSEASTVFSAGEVDDVTGRMALWTHAVGQQLVVSEPFGDVPGQVGGGVLYVLDLPVDTGDLGPSDATIIGPIGRGAGEELLTADLTGDGIDDLLVYHSMPAPMVSGALFLLDGASPEIRLDETTSILWDDVRQPGRVAVGSFCGDEAIDLAVQTGSGQVDTHCGPFEPGRDVGGTEHASVHVSAEIYEVAALATGCSGHDALVVTSRGSAPGEDTPVVWFVFDLPEPMMDLTAEYDADAPRVAWFERPDSLIEGFGGAFLRVEERTLVAACLPRSYGMIELTEL